MNRCLNKCPEHCCTPSCGDFPAGDGYIHFSDAAQVAATYQKYFSNQAEVWLLTVSKTALLNSLIRIIGESQANAALRYEPSRGGALFAHLYAPLPLAAVLEARPYRANEVLG